MSRVFFANLRTVLPLVAFATYAVDAQEPLDQWRVRQQKIKRVVDNVGPCVVAIEGGCGVIISEHGHVLTVSHVTGAAGRRVNVQLADGTSVMGTTLGINRNLDISALKLDEDRQWPYLKVPELSLPRRATDDDAKPKVHLTATQLDASEPQTQQPPDSSLEPGTWCLAFGYPLSFKRGQPAAVRLGRVQSVDAKQIVTSAVIMGGDSGGPLVDLDGRLIGISSRVKSEIDANLHVPIHVYRDQWDQLLAGVVVEKIEQDGDSSDEPKRPWLGIFGDTDESRVRVRQVQAGSPADKAGLKPEDVIVSFGGADVAMFSEVIKRLQSLRPGDTVTFQVNRYGTIVNLSATLGLKP